MKTLVIHPFDLTTSFLVPIYDGRGWTVIDVNPSTKLLKESIKSHDRIVMLGHGGPRGLLGFNREVINSELVYLLREKECVCIWCYADEFVKKYKLNSTLYTGMMISEYEEAIMYAIQPKDNQIFESNTLFSNAVRKAIFTDEPLKIMQEYNIPGNPIVEFNKQLIYSCK